MPVEDVFDRGWGRGVLVTGLVERGRVRGGDTVAVVGGDGDAVVVIGAVETGDGPVLEASAGTSISVLLPGGTAVHRVQVLASPGSIEAHRAFTAEITLLPEEDGGSVVRVGTEALVHLRTALASGTVLPASGTELRPGASGRVAFTLDRPVALEKGQRVAIRLRGRAAGSGTVTRLGA
ncbi:hypothetical protein [Streptomyces sp. NPDC097619]|uniref:EF-Tu C-terminal domain-related protein n=1 Tax=Streptomyces sp. NPDC097619 TaxID=3157228 RepID=UPI0033241786